MTLLARNVVPMLNRGWTDLEFNAIEGYVSHLMHSFYPGLSFDTQSGLTDEGDPWTVVTRQDAEIIFTFARERSANGPTYIITSRGSADPETTHDLVDYLSARIGRVAAARLGLLQKPTRKPLVPLWARQVLISLLVVVGMDAVEVGLHRQMNTVHAALLMLGLI